MKSKHGNSWTAGELKKLQALAKRKLSARLAAAQLGRSTGAVKYKAMIEGIRFQNVVQPPGVQKRLARKRRRAQK